MIRYSIVVPTRNRPETLQFCLKTLLAQNYDGLEIIISDNSDVDSAHETRKTVHEAGSSLIKYIRPDKTLSMTDNWEFALNHVSGEYVVFIGDDDGLTLHALAELDKVFSLSAATVISWWPAYYNWPDLPDNLADRINVPLRQNIQWVVGQQIIKRVIEFRQSYTVLPMLYNSAVRRDLIDEIKERKGRFFYSESPDIYSGFVVARQCGKYLKTDVPFSISGTSAKANGFATLFGGNKDVATDFDFLNASSESSSRHMRSPKCKLLPTYVSSSFNWARDNLFPNDSFLEMSDADLVRACLGALSGLSERAVVDALDMLTEFFSQNKSIFYQIDNYRKGRKPGQSSPTNVETTNKKTYFNGGDFILLNGANFGIKNVYEFALFLEKLLPYKANGVEWSSILNKWSMKSRLREFVFRARKFVHYTIDL